VSKRRLIVTMVFPPDGSKKRGLRGVEDDGEAISGFRAARVQSTIGPRRDIPPKIKRGSEATLA